MSDTYRSLLIAQEWRGIYTACNRIARAPTKRNGVRNTSERYLCAPQWLEGRRTEEDEAEFRGILDNILDKLLAHSELPAMRTYPCMLVHTCCVHAHTHTGMSEVQC